MLDYTLTTLLGYTIFGYTQKGQPYFELPISEFINSYRIITGAQITDQKGIQEIRSYIKERYKFIEKQGIMTIYLDTIA